MSKIYIEGKDLKRLIDEESSKAIDKLSNLLKLFHGKTLEERLSMLNGKLIEDIVHLQIEENFVKEFSDNTHILMTNRKITSILPNRSSIETQITSQRPLYGQSIIQLENGFLSAGGSSPAGQASNLMTVYSSTDALNYYMQESRKFSSIVQTDNYIFIVGGINSSGTSLDTIEIYTKDLQIVTILQMRNQRAYPLACFYNGFVYVASEETLYIEKFDPNNLQNILEPIKGNWNEPIRFLGVFKGYLILFGKENYYILSMNDKLVSKHNCAIEYKWTQSQCAYWDSGLYFVEYFSGRVEFIKINSLIN